MRLRVALCSAVVCLLMTVSAFAQDAVKVDPQHYSVVSENDQVRILRVHYGAHEKFVMHSHPATVAVFFTDSQARFTFADGKKQDVALKAGEAQYDKGSTHLPENTGDTAMDAIVVELKGPAKSEMK